MRTETLTYPHYRLGMPCRGRFDGLLAELATHAVDRDERVAALRDIGSNSTMAVASFTVR